ncbi:MAG: mycothiol synthase [Ferrimicrobium sp.]
MDHVNVQLRRAEDHLSSLLELAREIEKADRHRALEDHRWIDFTAAGGHGVLGLIATHPASSVIAGYLRISQGSKGYEFELLVRPTLRTYEPTISNALIARGITEVIALGGQRISIWIPHPNDTTDHLLGRFGFLPDREVVQLRRPLPLEYVAIDAASTLRTFVIHQDELAWLELNNRAFDWHPEQGDWTLETIKEHKAEPWFDPKGFFLFEVDGQLRGFCWTKVHQDTTPPAGEIYVIGVDPNYTRHGLGATLLTAGLDHLARDCHLTTAMLYVEATNTRARQLYDRFGFHLDHLDRRYIWTRTIGSSVDSPKG